MFNIFLILINHKHHSLTKISKLSICIVSLEDKLVTLSVPDYLNNTGTPIICYKYNKPIRSTVFNFNEIVTDMDINFNTPDPYD